MNDQPLKGILLVSDVDGTLITRRFEMPRRNVEAIRRFTRKGGLFALATGRSEESAAPYAAQAGVNAPSVLLNGAALYDFQKGEILWQACLPGSFRQTLRQIMRRFPDIGVEIFAADASLSSVRTTGPGGIRPMRSSRFILRMSIRCPKAGTRCFLRRKTAGWPICGPSVKV